MSRAKELIDALTIEESQMRAYLIKAFDMYNDLMDHMAKINVHDKEIANEWKKVDKAFDNILNIANKKDLLL